MYASKPRPALIIQDDLFDITDSVTVVPLRTDLTDATLLRIRVSHGDLSGLEHDSDIVIDKLTTVRRSNARERLGRVSTTQLAEVERSLMAFLGLAG